MVSIKGLDRADVLAALYNASHPQGLSFLCFDSAPMTADEARQHLQAAVPWGLYIDYIKGRVIKVAFLSEEEFNEKLYDRDIGPGAAQRAIDALRRTI